MRCGMHLQSSLLRIASSRQFSRVIGNLQPWTQQHGACAIANLTLNKGDKRLFHVSVKSQVDRQCKTTRRQPLYLPNVWAPEEDQVLQEKYKAVFEAENSPFDPNKFYQDVQDALPYVRTIRPIAIRCQQLGLIDDDVLPERLSGQYRTIRYRPCHEIVLANSIRADRDSMKWASSLSSVHAALREAFQEAFDPTRSTRERRFLFSIATNFQTKVRTLNPANSISPVQALRTVAEFAANRGIRAEACASGGYRGHPYWTVQHLQCILDFLKDSLENSSIRVKTTGQIWDLVNDHIRRAGLNLPGIDGTKEFEYQFKLPGPAALDRVSAGMLSLSLITLPDLSVSQVNDHLKLFVTKHLPDMIVDASSNDDKIYLGRRGSITIVDPRYRRWGPSEVAMLTDILLEDIVAQAEDPSLGPIKIDPTRPYVMPKRAAHVARQLFHRFKARWPDGFVPGHPVSITICRRVMLNRLQVTDSPETFPLVVNQNWRPWNRGWCWWRVQEHLAGKLREANLTGATTAAKVQYLKSLEYAVDCEEDLRSDARELGEIQRVTKFQARSKTNVDDGDTTETAQVEYD